MRKKKTKEKNSTNHSQRRHTVKWKRSHWEISCPRQHPLIEAEPRKVHWWHNYHLLCQREVLRIVTDGEPLVGLLFDRYKKVKMVRSFTVASGRHLILCAFSVPPSADASGKTRYATRYSTRLAATTITEESTTTTNRRTTRFTSD